TYPSIATWLSSTAPPPPVAPSGVFATKIKKTKAVLKWFDNSSDEDSFVLVFWNGSSWTDFGTLGPNAVKAKVTGMSPHTGYSLGVKACRGGACSEVDSV